MTTRTPIPAWRILPSGEAEKTCRFYSDLDADPFDAGEGDVHEVDVDACDATLTFRDAAGTQWLRRTNGTLEARA